MRTFDFGDFRMQIDGGFGVHTVVLRGPDSAAGVVAGRPAQFRATLVIARSERPLKHKAELESFADVSVNLLKQQPGFKQISRETIQLPSKSQGVLQRHRFKNEHGLEVEQLQLYLLQKGPALIITATDLAATFAEHRENLLAMLLSTVEC
jgi:hypothetical protein